MSVSPRVRDSAILLVALLVALLALQLSGLAFWQGLAATLGIFIVLTVSLNLANGFTGVFTLGQIGFMALGAYISAILTLPQAAKAAFLPDLPAWLAWISLDQTIGWLPVGWLVATLIAALIVSAVAALVGAVLMRLSGPFVSVATLGFLVIVRVVLLNADSFTRGSRAFSNVTRYTDMWLAFGVAVVTVYVVWRLKRSGYGRAMFAQREDRWAANSVGVSVLRPRLQAFVISAFFTAVAGSLYAHFLGSFSPNAFYFDTTFEVVTMLVVGGMGSVSGSVIGATAMLSLGEALRRLEEPTQLYGIGGIIIASVLIAVLIFRPSGIMGQREISFDRLFSPWRKGDGSGQDEEG